VDPSTGKGYSEACGHDYALARARRDSKRSELRDGACGKLPDKSLADLIDAIPTFMAGKRGESARKLTESLTALKNVVGDVRVSAIEPGLIMTFRAERLAQPGRKSKTLSPATVNKDVRHIRAALSKAKRAKWLKVNPLLDWEDARLPEPERGVRVIMPDAFAKILANEADAVLKLVWTLAYQTGMRRAELANLRWQWVDTTSGVIQVVNTPEAGEFTKSNKVRTIPMTADIQATVAAALKLAPQIIDAGKARPKFPHVFAWPDGRALEPGYLSKRFAKAAKAAGVKATLHDERRSWSTLAQAAGVDKMTVKDLGGWSDVKVVEKHYTGSVLPAHRAAMERIGRATAAG